MQQYSMEWLLEKYAREEKLKYLFFWGAIPRNNEQVDESCFSQWYNAPFVVDGVTYKTAEHWMMAKKALLFNDHTNYEKILKANTPGEAKQLGREVVGYIDELWLSNRYEIVKQGNIHKFTQHPELKDYIKNTNNRILVEASPVDEIWGIGMAANDPDIGLVDHWRGLNLLGFALMEVRDIIIAQG